MSINVTVNGTQYSIPTNGEESWGANVSALLLALSTGLLQKSGGSFPLTAEVDFGGSFGVATLHIKSKTALPATSGVLRLATGDKIVWRNFDNTGNVNLEYFRNTDFNYNIVKVDDKELVNLDSQQYITNKIFGTADAVAIDSSAIFEVRSTTKGALPYPRMTTTQRNAIVSPATGLIVYNLTDSAVQFYNGVGWVSPAVISNTPLWTETFLAPTAAATEARYLRKDGGLEESVTTAVFNAADSSQNFLDAAVDTGTDTINIVAHGFLTGDLCLLSTTGVLPSPFAINTTYYIIKVDDDNFQIAVSYSDAKAGTEIVITSAIGGGTHTVSVKSGTRFLTSPFLPNGTAANPGLPFEDDTDTGLFRPGDNQLGIAAGGAKVGEFNSNGYMGLDNRIIFVDSKAASTNGGTATSGAWRTRDITNLIINRIAGASLSTNQITLPAGTYRWVSEHPAYTVNQHQAKLYNITDTSDVGFGASSYTSNTESITTNSKIVREFTIASSKVFEVQHRVSTTRATDGWGIAASFATENIYSQGEIIKIA